MKGGDIMGKASKVPVKSGKGAVKTSVGKKV
jgi:hypothetical protein